MPDTPKRDHKQDAVGEFAVLLSDIEREAIPDHLTRLAVDLDAGLATAQPLMERA